jgi:hypothetical protein
MMRVIEMIVHAFATGPDAVAAEIEFLLSALNHAASDNIVHC